MVRFWVAVACLEHVKKGEAGGFAQVCHGKKGPLSQMSEGDGIVYYSPTEIFGAKIPCRSFTAIGKVAAGPPYPYQMSEDFIPWRRDVVFFPSRVASIESLLAKLSFIKDQRRWGFPFRRGFFEIPLEDFRLIANAMGVAFEGQRFGF